MTKAKNNGVTWDACQALQEAIEIAGGPKALGMKLGISGPAVSQWRACPPRRVRAVSKITKISKHRLRPDIFDA